MANVSRTMLLVCGVQLVWAGAPGGAEEPVCGAGGGGCHEDTAMLQVSFATGDGANACPHGVYYVSPSGDGASDGCSKETPLHSLAACTGKVGVKKCLLLGGVYYEEVLIEGIADLTIAAVEGADVLFDGTTTLSGWEGRSDAHGWYYRSVEPVAANNEVWQLFVDGEPLTPARFPNVRAWSEEAWSREKGWATEAATSTCGHLVDAGTSASELLSDTGVSMNGCNLILNNQHWKTWRYVVTNHAAGSGELSYDGQALSASLCEKYAGDGRGRYFIDGCEAAFDVAGEWVKASDGHLLLRLPGHLESEDISSLTITGKRQTYAIACKDCENLVIRGLRFYATTIFVHDSTNSLIEGNKFDYPSASRRSLGGDVQEFDAAEAFGYGDRRNQVIGLSAGPNAIAMPTTWIGKKPWVVSTGSRFINNKIWRSEGAGVLCSMCYDGAVFANNEIGETGYPYASAIWLYGSNTHRVLVERNTLYTNGNGGVNKLWGEGNTVRLNRVWDSARLIVDAQGIGGGRPTSGAQVYFNWVHDSTGLGLRYDSGEDGKFPSNNTFEHNVVWGNLQGGISEKSNEALDYRNTAIGNQDGSDPEAAFGGLTDDFKIAYCYPVGIGGVCAVTSGSNQSLIGRPNSSRTNFGSVLRGNVGRIGFGLRGITDNDMPGEVDHNLNLRTQAFLPDALFRDASNLDFRPLPHGPLVNKGADSGRSTDVESVTVGSAPDIGAYEAGDTFYWIPGRQSRAASSPVPPDGATGVRPEADLMWLPGSDAAKHVVTLRPKSAPESAVTCTADAGATNIFTPPGKLKPNTAYEWKADTVLVDGTTVPGEWWSFTPSCADAGCEDCGENWWPGSCNRCADPTLHAPLCVPEGSCVTGELTRTFQVGNARPKEYTAPGGPGNSIVAREVVGGCDNHGGKTIRAVLESTGEELGTIACSTAWTWNNLKQEPQTFNCVQCAAGYHLSAAGDACEAEDYCDMYSITASFTIKHVHKELTAESTDEQDMISLVNATIPGCERWNHQAVQGVLNSTGKAVGNVFCSTPWFWQNMEMVQSVKCAVCKHGYRFSPDEKCIPDMGGVQAWTCDAPE